AQCSRAISPSGGDAGSQSIAGGGSYDQHVARSAVAPQRRLLGDGNLPLNIQAASFRMRIDTDKTARAALDDLSGHGNGTDTLQREQPIVQRALPSEYLWG